MLAKGQIGKSFPSIHRLLPVEHLKYSGPDRTYVYITIGQYIFLAEVSEGQ